MYKATPAMVRSTTIGLIKQKKMQAATDIIEKFWDNRETIK